MKEMIEKLKKMSLIKKIITIYTVVVIFQYLCWSAIFRWFSMRNYTQRL